MKNFLLLFFAGFQAIVFGQTLRPGFDKAELIDMIRISHYQLDEEVFGEVPAPKNFEFEYRSQVFGLDNQWSLFLHTSEKIGVINTRGTTSNPTSWLENFYAAMVPASGTLSLGADRSFQYHLSDHPSAAVHVGWLVGMAFVSGDLLPKLDSLYREGFKDFILSGHSQGGAITYLLTAHLRQLQLAGKLPDDIRFKTYCSAAPKPGNLYFAYSYEAMTQFGWAFNVVNSADWVPEVPLTVQTTDDFNKTNPFTNARSTIKAQGFPQNLALKKVYNSFDKPSRRAQRNYQKYLGDYTSAMVSKQIPGFDCPPYYESSNYVRAGAQIVLYAKADYFAIFPENKDTIFVHHFPLPFLYLADQLPDLSNGELKKTENMAINPDELSSDSLAGKWMLNFIYQPLGDFDEMYPNGKPTLIFGEDQLIAQGFAGCNQLTASTTREKEKLIFNAPFGLTRKFCEGMSELHFVETLKRVKSFKLPPDGQLELLERKRVLMRFERVANLTPQNPRDK